MENKEDLTSAYYWSVNAGKEIIFLDLTLSKDLETFYKTKLSPGLELFERRLANIDRIKVVFFLFFLYAIIIISTSFKYSVMEYKYYSNLAE